MNKTFKPTNRKVSRYVSMLILSTSYLMVPRLTRISWRWLSNCSKNIPQNNPLTIPTLGCQLKHPNNFLFHLVFILCNFFLSIHCNLFLIILKINLFQYRISLNIYHKSMNRMPNNYNYLWKIFGREMVNYVKKGMKSIDFIKEGFF